MADGDRELRPVPAGGGPFVLVADLASPTLTDDDHHHLARARRLRTGDELVLGDATGRWCPARFAGHHPEPVGDPVTAPRPTPPVSVAFALVKGTKPELVVQKLTELGVDRISPFVAARSVVRWDAARSASASVRLERVAREASMQSRRPWLPTVDPVGSFAELSGSAGACRADRDGAPPSLDHPLILTCPEGGWSPGEATADLPVVTLGGGVLRAETAAIVAGVVLTALRDGLVVPASGHR
ncbi:16S rRNA (uracil(1498)-N(3))-methyltransferase [soil metagenome]